MHAVCLPLDRGATDPSLDRRLMEGLDLTCVTREKHAGYEMLRHMYQSIDLCICKICFSWHGVCPKSLGITEVLLGIASLMQQETFVHGRAPCFCVPP